MNPRTLPPSSGRPGYGKLLPISLGCVAVILLLSCPFLLVRNIGFTPFEKNLTGRVIDYSADSLRVRLMEGDRERGMVSVRDDRPWRVFERGEAVRLLIRSTTDEYGEWYVEYAVDDFRAMWGPLIGRVVLALLSGASAAALLVFGRRRPSVAYRFPPPVPAAARQVVLRPPPSPGSGVS